MAKLGWIFPALNLVYRFSYYCTFRKYERAKLLNPFPKGARLHKKESIFKKAIHKNALVLLSFSRP